MAQNPPVLTRLLGLIERLYNESDGYLDHPENEQLWYNRGYANGMIRALHDMGYREQLRACVEADAADSITGQEALSWGRAYLHGLEMGVKETREVIGPAASR